MAQPFDPVTETMVTQIARKIEGYLGLQAADAVRQARRSVFAHRDRLFHEMLMLDLAPERLHDPLDAMVVQGIEHVANVPQGRGVLLLSLHYSVFNSLLTLWLARAAARGLFGHLTVLIDAGQKKDIGLSAHRFVELERAGVFNHAAFSLLYTAPGPGAARQLVARLRAGEAVLVYHDATFLPASADQSLRLMVGQQAVGVPSGAAWLARMTGCSIVPVFIRPEEDTYAIVFAEAAAWQGAAESATVVQSVLQRLIDHTVLVDPAAWAAWPGLPERQAGLPGAPTDTV